MERILTGYEVNHATWFYLSFLLIVTVFFRFHRVWSLRNLDLALLLSIGPGLLLLEAAAAERPGTDNHWTWFYGGYTWLLTVTVLVLLRLFCDSLFQRRPRLEQNLNTPGLLFLGIASFAFLVSSVMRQTEVPASARRTIEQAENVVHGGDEAPDAPRSDPDTSVGLASHLLLVPTTALDFDVSMTARIAAILSHLAVVLGLCYIGWEHFRDVGVGLAMATLYVLLPPTSTFAGEVNHVLPAALVVWTFATVRQPLLAGALMGLACGTHVFAVFLVPLWCSWYGRRGIIPFLTAWVSALVVVVLAVAITARSNEAAAAQLMRAVDWAWLFALDREDGGGFWELQNAAYRIPAFVGFLVMLAVLVFWPLSKNLDQLIARSAAVVVGAQFWYPQQGFSDRPWSAERGGLYVLWYLPLVLLVVFRPNLDRVTFDDDDEERTRRADDPDDADTPTTVGNASGRYVFR